MTRQRRVLPVACLTLMVLTAAAVPSVSHAAVSELEVEKRVALTTAGEARVVVRYRCADGREADVRVSVHQPGASGAAVQSVLCEDETSTAVVPVQAGGSTRFIVGPARACAAVLERGTGPGGQAQVCRDVELVEAGTGLQPTAMEVHVFGHSPVDSPLGPFLPPYRMVAHLGEGADAHASPLAGRSVDFYIDGRRERGCTAVTDERGEARCSSDEANTAALREGFLAVFAGDEQHLSAAARWCAEEDLGEDASQHCPTPPHPGIHRGAVTTTGGPIFWDGGDLGGPVPHPLLCGQPHLCPVSTFDLVGEAHALRVAFDVRFRDPDHVRRWPDPAVPRTVEHLVRVRSAPVIGDDRDAGLTWPDESVLLRLFDPSGALAMTRQTVNRYSIELVVEDPLPGRWTIQVVPVDAEALGFRMRAAAQRYAPPPAGKQVLPDLRVLPAFELNFHAPTAHAEVNGPTSSAPAGAPSCMAIELVEAAQAEEERALTCLRFSLALENVGDAPIAIGCEEGTKTPCLVTPGSTPARQILFETDPAAEPSRGWTRPAGSRPAGQIHYSASHGHQHYEGFLTYELFTIEDPDWTWPSKERPAVRRSAHDRKFGYYPAPDRMAGWEQVTPNTDASAPCVALLCLAPGWSDVYEHNRAGNYVPFPEIDGKPRPGTYLVRGQANPQGWILEADTSNNWAYTLFKVEIVDGHPRAHILERGRGPDPWAAERVVLTPVP